MTAIEPDTGPIPFTPITAPNPIHPAPSPAEIAPGWWAWACSYCTWNTGRHRDIFTAQQRRADHLTRHH